MNINATILQLFFPKKTEVHLSTSVSLATLMY